MYFWSKTSAPPPSCWPRGLREHAHAVDVVHDGVSACQRLAESDYDIVVLDVMLPGRNGLDGCRQLRLAGKHVPVLMLTAQSIAAAPNWAALDMSPYEPPKPAPSFALPDLDGKVTRLEDLRGKVVVLFFWSTW